MSPRINCVRLLIVGDRVRPQVFESNPVFAVEGSVVLMNLNGQAAIEAIDPVLLERYAWPTIKILGLVLTRGLTYGLCLVVAECDHRQSTLNSKRVVRPYSTVRVRSWKCHHVLGQMASLQ
jgi:hypothetical protein